MPKAMVIKALADGQLAAAKATLYTVPASTQAIVRLITLVNTDSVARTVNIYLRLDGTNSRRIIAKDQSMAAGASFPITGPFTLEAADLVQGDASAANVVDFTLNGVEEV